VADLQSLRIMRHLPGSARRRQPLRSEMLQPSAAMTLPMTTLEAFAAIPQAAL
jgi:hypothetical protein